jgi:hypothetical protein
MHDSFGARLRQHREQKHVSLADIAEQTKIKASLLEGLERDDISQWPAGIFRRAYVRSYASAIGFDPDAAVREFLTRHPDRVEMAEPAPPAPGGLRGLFGSLRRRPATPSPQPVLESAAVTPAPATEPPAAATAQPSEAVRRHPDASDRTSTDSARDAGPRTGEPAARPLDDSDRSSEPDLGTSVLLTAAQICTELGRVEDVGQILPLLGEAAKVLRARGLIVWVWDGTREELKPALVHGYSGKVRARLRGVSPTADNLTAAAYRAGAPLARSGALAVPLLIPSGCTGVLAIEIDSGREQDEDLRALATFFAAMLAQLVASPAGDAHDGDATVRVVAGQPG